MSWNYPVLFMILIVMVLVGTRACTFMDSVERDIHELRFK